MGLFTFIKAKILRINNSLDNLVTVQEKLNLAKSKLEDARVNVKEEAVAIHDAFKKATAEFKLSQNEIAEAKKLINDAMKVGNEDLAKRLFTHLEGLQAADKIYTKTLADVTKRKEEVDKYCSTLDSKIKSTDARIESLSYVRQAQEKTKMFGKVTFTDIDKYIKDIEKFVQDEEWHNESKEEVEALFVNPIEEAKALSQGSDNTRWEKYKADNNLSAQESKK